MTPAGTPFGGEWIYGVWSPVSVIPFAAVDNYWGRAVGGKPWSKQMDQGACWITHRPHFIPKDPTWGRETSWTSIPTGYTSIYRHTFSVDKESSANLYIFTNDIVDVYFDPIEPEPARWFANTLIEWQGPNPLQMNHPWQDQPSYYYVGRADKQTRGMKIDLSNLITPGTHTLYFVHRNSSELRPIPPKDYYGLLFALYMESDSDHPGDFKRRK